MPTTARLSREFFERFGDKVVNEMVDLFNRIEDAARSDLRLLDEQNALRFEARLSQQTALGKTRALRTALLASAAYCRTLMPRTPATGGSVKQAHPERARQYHSARAS